MKTPDFSLVGDSLLTQQAYAEADREHELEGGEYDPVASRYEERAARLADIFGAYLEDVSRGVYLRWA